jgi:hypothetical protein
MISYARPEATPGEAGSLYRAGMYSKTIFLTGITGITGITGTLSE